MTNFVNFPLTNVIASPGGPHILFISGSFFVVVSSNDNNIHSCCHVTPQINELILKNQKNSDSVDEKINVKKNYQNEMKSSSPSEQNNSKLTEQCTDKNMEEISSDADSDSDDDMEEDDDHQENESIEDKNYWITYAHFHRSGNFLACTDNKKYIHIWKYTSNSYLKDGNVSDNSNMSDRWRLYWLIKLPKSATVIKWCNAENEPFNKKENSINEMTKSSENIEDQIYVADKFGELRVFSINLQKKEDDGKKTSFDSYQISKKKDMKPILGHISMLTDFIIDNDKKWIYTCDRDEKLKRSYMERPYVIDSYGLGHTEYISSMLIPSWYKSLLISGGGDSKLLFWSLNITSCMKTTYKVDLRVLLKDHIENTTSQLNILKIFQVDSSSKIGLILEEYPILFILTVEFDKINHSVSLFQTIQWKDGHNFPIDAITDSLDNLWVITWNSQGSKADRVSQIYSYRYDLEKERFLSRDISNVFSEINRLMIIPSFFEGRKWSLKDFGKCHLRKWIAPDRQAVKKLNKKMKM